MTNFKWEPTNYQKERLICSTKKYITQKLDDLHNELRCPNEFIYNLINDIQKGWDPNSNKLKAQKLQKNIN